MLSSHANIYKNMKSIRSILFVLIIPSAFVLLLATSLLTLTVNTSLAFAPQQQPPTAGQQQPQQQPQTGQSNQSLSAQQNTTQLIQSAQQPPPQQQLQQPRQPPQQPSQVPQISWDQLEEAESFIANGKMNSTLYTTNGNWRSTGDWSMNVADGELMNFTTNMAWWNGTAGHSHEFLNFEADDDVDISAEDQTISVAGTMDVGTNGAVAWEDVPSEIAIQGGKIISVSVDNEATDEHFSGQSVHGTITSLRICSDTPGPAMQVSPGC